MSKRRLGLLAALLVMPVAGPWADELFAATEVKPWKSASELWFAAEEEPSSPLFAVEPAAGHETAQASEGEGGQEGEGSEPKKAKSGKELTKKPELPHVTVGGVDVVTQDMMIARETSASIPDILKKPIYNDVLGVRLTINAYAHAPVMGDPKAPIKIVEFADLSCGKCLEDLQHVDEFLKPYVSRTLMIHVHAASSVGQGVNMAAFYGKLAERTGKFWAYRAKVIETKPESVDAILGILTQLGIGEREAREMLLNESRRFYRELDADALVARSYGTGQTPTVFVNGIRVGGEGIPIEKLPSVMEYVTQRLKNNLPEPPQ